MIQFDAISYLKENPLILFFLVASTGYAIGRLRIFGFSLGISAVLFTGIAFGALDPNMKLPEFVYLFGLVIFVYTIGLSTAAGFKSSLRKQGIRDNVFCIVILFIGAMITFLVHIIFNLSPTLTSGLFAGSFTNTPALAAVLETVKETIAPCGVEKALSEPVFAYSIAYPFGVIGVMLGIFIMQKIWKIDYQKEAHSIKDIGFSMESLSSSTIKVTKKNINYRNKTLHDFQNENKWNVIFTRLKRDDQFSLVNGNTTVQENDLFTMLGTEENIKKVTDFFGEHATVELDLDRTVIDYRKIMVSNQEIVEKPLGELFISQRYGAIITRVRRGDSEFLADKNTVLKLGDQVSIVGLRTSMNKLSKYFGDSIKAISEIDVISFSIGITLGLIIGSIPIPLPGDNTFKLGFAGGPLLVGLYLGIKGRTGQLIWQLPMNANITLRQIGLIMFLAGIGTRSGYAFFSTLRDGSGYSLFLGGAIITFLSVIIALYIGYKWLKIPMGILTGMVSGIHTQPAVLAFSNEQAKHELPHLGYATVYPISMIAKILLAQAILLVLLQYSA